MSGIKTASQRQHRIAKSTRYQSLILRLLQPMDQGRLKLVLPSGEECYFGTREEGGVSAEMTVHRPAFFKKCVLFGDVGFGEAYVDGDWSSPDVAAVIRWMLFNLDHHPTLMDDRQKKVPVNWLKMINRATHWLRDNTKKGSAKNISKHYDLSNQFFALMLDESMTYSSAYFIKPNQSLAEAQAAKYDRLCRQLRLKPTDHLLEIGTGWGGMAVHAAKFFGCHVTTTTISQEQFHYAKRRVQEEGLTERVNVINQDYRDLTGAYDKIVSIEMIEAVGHKHLKSYFAQCHRLLKRNGLLALQAILAPDHRYNSFRNNVDWIQKHIFPGSLLPSLTALQSAVQATGDLCLHDFKDMSSDYAKTLRCWSERFEQQLEEVKALGFDEMFVRQWRYYLAYCEAAFAMHNIFVAQIVWSRANNALFYRR